MNTKQKAFRYVSFLFFGIYLSLLFALFSGQDEALAPPKVRKKFISCESSQIGSGIIKSMFDSYVWMKQYPIPMMDLTSPFCITDYSNVPSSISNLAGNL